MADDVDEKVVTPHGRDESGIPLAPFGYKTDGNPKLSHRGRAPANAGPKVAAPQKKASGASSSSPKKKPRTAKETREQLLGLADMVATPLAAAGLSKAVRDRIGERQGDALAGDAVIFRAAAPDLVDGLMAYAEHKPGVLAFLDRAEDVAPALIMAKALGGLAVAVARNHMQPSRELAAGARSMVNAQALAYAREMARVELEAAEQAEQAAADLEAFREKKAAEEQYGSVPGQRVA